MRGNHEANAGEQIVVLLRIEAAMIERGARLFADRLAFGISTGKYQDDSQH